MLLDFPSQVPSVQSIPPESVPSTIPPKSVPGPESVPGPVPSSDEGIQDNAQPLKQYFRKKVRVPQSVQVQSPVSATVQIPETRILTTERQTSLAEPSQPTDNHEKPDDEDLPIALRKGTRACTKHPLYLFLTYQNLSQSHRAFLSSLHTITIPRNFSEALEDKKWENAMKVEMEALVKNNTWELVELQKGVKSVGCRWVFTVKYKSDGSIERYKARLIAKGYTQMYGIDYLETFAPVAKMSTMRVLLSSAVNFRWNLQQFDVKNAFLHGDLEEEVYMEVPRGFESKEGMVCKLKKALYGLKQSPRAWFGRLTKVMIAAGYKRSQGDHTLFIRHSDSGGVKTLLVYVDGMIVIGNDTREMQELKQQLLKEFDIKELGRLKYFLGIEVAHSK